MKVMPMATQPMNEIALSNALTLSDETNPGVARAKIAIVAPRDHAHGQDQMPTPRSDQTKSDVQRDVAHTAAA
jgi:hypothetical protein